MEIRRDITLGHVSEEPLQDALPDCWPPHDPNAPSRLQRIRTILDNRRRAAGDQQTVDTDPHFALAQTVLLGAGALGCLYVLSAYALLLQASFKGSLDLTLRGVSSFVRQIDGPEPLLAVWMTGGALLITALPWPAALGLSLRRRWGWTLGVVAFLGWLVAFPPIGAYGLYVLFRASVIQHFFADRTRTPWRRRTRTRRQGMPLAIRDEAPAEPAQDAATAADDLAGVRGISAQPMDRPSNTSVDRSPIELGDTSSRTPGQHDETPFFAEEGAATAPSS